MRDGLILYPNLMASMGSKLSVDGIDKLVPAFDIVDDRFSIQLYTARLESTSAIVKSLSVNGDDERKHMQHALSRQIMIPSVIYDQKQISIDIAGDVVADNTIIDENKKMLKLESTCKYKGSSFIEVGITLMSSNQNISILFNRICTSAHWSFFGILANLIWLAIKTAVVVGIVYLGYSLLQTHVLPKVRILLTKIISKYESSSHRGRRYNKPASYGTVEP